MKSSLFWNLFLILCLMAPLAGCGKNRKALPPVTSPLSTELIEKKKSEAKGHYWEKLTFQCEEPICPEALAKVVVYEGKRSFECTGFLVAEDVVATGRSCLPTTYLNKRNLCDEKMAIIFPEVDNGEKDQDRLIIGCDRVITFGESANLDYAFIQLERPIKRRPLEFDYSGIEDGEELTVWTMNPMQRDSSTKIESHTCKSVMMTMLNPLYSHKDASKVVLAHCPLEKGSLGSPVLDREGKVKAIANTTYDMKSYLYFGNKNPTKMPPKLSQMAGAINVSCLNDGVLQGRTGPECDIDQSAEREKVLLNELFNEILKKEWSAQDMKYIPFMEMAKTRFKLRPVVVDTDTLSLANGYTAFKQRSGIMIVPQAYCYHAGSLPSPNMRLYRQTEWKLPVWRLEMIYDEYLRPSFKLEFDRAIGYVMRSKLKLPDQWQLNESGNLNWKQVVHMDGTIFDGLLNFKPISSDFLSKELPACVE